MHFIGSTEKASVGGRGNVNALGSEARRYCVGYVFVKMKLKHRPRPYR